MIDKTEIQERYNKGYITNDQLKQYVELGVISQQDFEELSGESYTPYKPNPDNKLFWDRVMVATGQKEAEFTNATYIGTNGTYGIFLNSEGWGTDNFLPSETLRPKTANGLFKWFRFKEADTSLEPGTQNNNHLKNSMVRLFENANKYYNTDESNKIELDFSECTDFRGLFGLTGTNVVTADHQICHTGFIDFTALTTNGKVDTGTLPSQWLTTTELKLPQIDYGRVNNFAFFEMFGSLSNARKDSSPYIEEIKFAENSGDIIGNGHLCGEKAGIDWRMPSKNVKSFEGYYHILSHLSPSVDTGLNAQMYITNSEPSGKNYWWNVERFKEAFYYLLAKHWNTPEGRERLGIEEDNITREIAMNWFVEHMQPDFANNSTYITLPQTYWLRDSNNKNIGVQRPDLKGAGWTFRFAKSENGASGSTGRCEPGWDVMTHNTSFEADPLTSENFTREEFEDRICAKNMDGFIPSSAQMKNAGMPDTVSINEYVKGCKSIYWNDNGTLRSVPDPSKEGYGQTLNTNKY